MTKLLLNKYKNINSINKDTNININLYSTSRLSNSTDVKDEINSYEIYQNEKLSCNKYRLIYTIIPYCSNVLFNILTEIVKNEGSDEVECIDDTIKSVNIPNDICIGKVDPNRLHMIMNTEYSNEKIGYIYHPGYDIFNNHIFRNKTFKIVNILKNENIPITDEWINFENIEHPKVKDVFNTIGDFLRRNDGENVKYKKRINYKEIDNNSKDKHLYLYDDILSMNDSINSNLIEENGWFGFSNKSNIQSQYYKSIGNDKGWNDIYINKVLNNIDSCKFIDMYPDRTLYSFIPKFNLFKHRQEYNWNICLTYPYRNDYMHPIVSNMYNGDGKTNGLSVFSVEKVIGIHEENTLLFKMYCKHNLKINDNIIVYYSNNDGKTYKRINTPIRITNIGDMKGENTEYCFNTTDTRILDTISESFLTNMHFRIRKLINGIESDYYVRIFKKLPNQKFKKELYHNGDNLENYLNNNTKINNLSIPFDYEIYKLGFSSNIYNDNIVQITFTDDIDLNNLVDNLGRPLSEIFVTTVKNNKGYREWYTGDYKNPNIEYSHCFGPITTGFEYYNDSEGNSSYRIFNKAKYSDIRIINNINFDAIGNDNCYSSKSAEYYIKLETEKEHEVSFNDEEFIGDIVEYNKNNCIEIVLSDAMFRFNTAQRELSFDNPYFKNFNYQEIYSDDYDIDNFKIMNYNADDINSGISIGGINLNTRMRPEGYFYKPHYNIKLHSLGNLKQSSHKDLKIKNASPIQINGIYIKIKTKLKHKLNINDVVYICDDFNNKWYTTNVVSCDDYSFIIKDITNEKGEKIGCIKLCDILNSKVDSMKFKIRKCNTDIPSYAAKIGNNTFLWREIDYNLDKDLVFANGYKYINESCNFYLKRQDPNNENGLLSSTVYPNDIDGIIIDNSQYEYKDTNNIVC